MGCCYRNGERININHAAESVAIGDELINTNQDPDQSASGIKIKVRPRFLMKERKRMSDVAMFQPLEQPGSRE